MSEVWAGTQVEGKDNQIIAVTKPHGPLIATDGKTLITQEMRERKVKLEDIHTPDQEIAVWLDPFTNVQWLE